MNRKASLKALLSVTEPPADPPPPAPSARVPAGAVRALGLTLGKLQDEAAAAGALREQLAAGSAVVELDPAAVDDSFVRDRLAADGEAELSDLVQSIQASGQQVPVLVRPHPDTPGRFQVAYGHRRLHAARRLGIRIKAVVRALSDAELVIAQGQENLGRQDLSFIERALFATHLAQRGFDRPTLHAALSVHSAEMTRYLAVTRAVPAEVVRAVGPAPKAGRTRWLEMARLLATDQARTAAQAALRAPGFGALPTDARFAQVFDTVRQAAEARGRDDVWRAEDGAPIVRIEYSANAVRLSVNEKLAPHFGRFLVGQLDALYRTFQAEVETEREKG